MCDYQFPGPDLSSHRSKTHKLRSWPPPTEEDYTNPPDIFATTKATKVKVGEISKLQTKLLSKVKLAH